MVSDFKSAIHLNSTLISWDYLGTLGYLEKISNLKIRHMVGLFTLFVASGCVRFADSVLKPDHGHLVSRFPQQSQNTDCRIA